MNSLIGKDEMFLKSVTKILSNRISKKPSPIHYWCDWPWTTLVVLCDGSVVCGCADPRGLRPVGNAIENDILQIWNNETMNGIRKGLISGNPTFCKDCGLKKIVTENNFSPNILDISPGPKRLFIEPTITCNISCFATHCNIESGIVNTRANKKMSFDLFKKIIDNTGPYLERLELFNYGEPFLNKLLPDMINYVRTNFPNVFTFTSTNGLVWKNDDELIRIIKSGIHELVFSVDGASPETYSIYRNNEHFNRVINNMKQIVKLRNQFGLRYPIITYRYILFKWNDNDYEMNAARELARNIGVDRLCWEITDHPKGCPSARFQPGMPDFENIKKEIWNVGATANALKENVPKALITPEIVRIVAASHEKLHFQTKILNKGNSLWYATSPDNIRFVTLGIQLLNEKKEIIERDFHRSLLSNNLHPNASENITVYLKAPEKGCYWLKFDMVMEGYGWFEDGGSDVTYVSLMVV